MKKNIKVVQRGVNNKALFNKINNIIYDAMKTLGIRWTSKTNRESFVDIIEDHLYDFTEEGTIEQPKTICDKRNNKSFNTGDTVIFEINYKQPHCVNTTKIEYHIDI